MKQNRVGKKKREMRNLLRRGRKWYFKLMVDGVLRKISLDTEDLELAKARRNAHEASALRKDWAKIQGPQAPVGTLERVFAEYEKVGGITKRAVGGNQSMLMQVVRDGLGQPGLEASEVKLSVLTKKLVRDFQDARRARYEAAAGADEKERRMARDRADRTSKSTYNQARSIFCHKRALIDRYRDAGIVVPDCVQEFCEAGAVGKMSSKVYFPASDAILTETFSRVDELRDSEVPVLEAAWVMFWCALATGCRRNEIADMRCSDLVELDGRLWVGAGLGKDGRQIRIPVIAWPVDPAGTARTPESVVRETLERRRAADGPAAFLLEGERYYRYDTVGDALNEWMGILGWQDEKKLHALRAYIASKLYARNPRLAQLYLRHKSIKTTEDFYGHFLTLSGALDMVPVAPPLAVVQTCAQAG